MSSQTKSDVPPNQIAPIPLTFAFLGASVLYEDAVEELLEMGFSLSVFCDASEALFCQSRLQELTQNSSNAQVEVACAGLFGITLHDPPIDWPAMAMQLEVEQFKGLEKDFLFHKHR